jgi:hypothetical protein
MRDFVQDLRYAIRQMARKPGVTVFAALSLALGIGANSTIFSLVNALLFRDLPGHRPQELVEVYSGTEGEMQYVRSDGSVQFQSFSSVISSRTRRRPTSSSWMTSRSIAPAFAAKRFTASRPIATAPMARLPMATVPMPTAARAVAARANASCAPVLG